MSEKDQIQFERISAYLTGNSHPDDRASFETELASDKRLRDELTIQKELKLAIELGGLNETLDEIHEVNFSHQNSKKNHWFGIAAGIAVIVSLGIWFANQPGPTESLFAEYVTIEPGLPVPMSSTSQYVFFDAMVDYKSEKYELAIEKWNGILAENPNNDTLNYFVGAALFNMENYEEALPYFAKAEQQAMSVFKNKAQWYAVLANLQLNNVAVIINLTPYSDSEYADKIIAIQKAL